MYSSYAFPTFSEFTKNKMPGGGSRLGWGVVLGSEPLPLGGPHQLKKGERTFCGNSHPDPPFQNPVSTTDANFRGQIHENDLVLIGMFHFSYS